MDERENSTAPAPAAPTTALPTVENPRPKPDRNRGLAITLLVVAILVVLGFVISVAAMVFAVQRPADSFVGSWAAGSQSLEIRADGEAQGTDGCNGQSSSWHLAGNSIAFDGFMGTMMACMSPGDRMLNGWLGQAATAQLEPGNPNKLIFFDQSNGLLGHMIRNGNVEPLPQEPVMPTGEPFFPGPADPSDPMPGRPDPRPMYPDLPNDQDRNSDENGFTP